jgi:hypothetical protein
VGKIEHAYKMFVWKPERKRPVGRPRHKYEENKMDKNGNNVD